MPVMPVIARELRSSARHPFTFHLRTVGAAALVLTSLVFGLNHGFGPQLGGRLFASLHLTLFLGTWILVPLLTADCISRERREGTLGLLFLTLLKPQDVVIAKSLAHGLRALTLWFAVLPVLMIPLLLGGVGWTEAIMSVLINFSTLCCALAAGLVGSAWSKTWLRSVVYGALIAICLAVALSTVAGQLLTYAAAPGGIGGQMFSDFSVSAGFGLLSNARGIWLMYLRMVAPGQMLWITTEVTLFSLLALALAIALAGAKIRRSWQETPPSKAQLWVQKKFFTPVLWLSFFRPWMRRKLERNPIGWLEQRSWSGRLVTWAWFAVVTSLYSAVLTDRNFFRSYDTIQQLMAWLLAGSLAMSAAGSFRRERESGVLELLLVSPMGENRIISGRLEGLWGQFLPAFVLLLGIWLYFSQLFHGGKTEAIFFYAITFVTLPVIGLYYSLRCRSFLAAFLMTLLVGLVAPLIASMLTNAPQFRIQLSGRAAFVQVMLALLFWILLHERLKRRAFPLDRFEG